MPQVTDAMDQYATCSHQMSSGVYLRRSYEALGKNLSIYLLVPWSAPQLRPGTRALVSGFPPLFVCGAWSVLGDSEVPRSPVHGPLRTPSTLERSVFIGLLPAHRVATNPPCCAWYLREAPTNL